MQVFGPVPSRRLGLSLGINHLPPKTCSYSCVYCQLGRTSSMTANRTVFSDPLEIYQLVKNYLDDLKAKDIFPDVVTFVSNGEPTLDKSLGEIIRRVKPLGVKTAVITNASLLWHPDVHAQLLHADFVSIKVDSVMAETWHRIDRPHGTLRLDKIANGIHSFAQDYRGTLLTETMLISGANDTEEEATAAAAFIADLHPDTAYLALPLRPPAEDWVHPPNEERLMDVYQIFSAHLPKVELLMGLPETDLATIGEEPIQQLLSTLMVHPLPKKDVLKYLKKNNFDWSMIEELIEKNMLRSISTQGKEFLVRKYPKS